MKSLLLLSMLLTIPGYAADELRVLDRPGPTLLESAMVYNYLKNQAYTR